MFEVVTGKQMKEIEQIWINEMGVPSLSLMESAANSIANVIRNHYALDKHILVIANVGNNGGDALAVARLIIQSGYMVSCSIVGDASKMTSECKLQADILSNMGIKPLPISEADFEDADVIVEGVFGIGLSRDVAGEYKSIIELINDSDCEVVSVDIPSGINADNGKVLGVAVNADITVELGIRKLGNHIYPGCEYAGKVIYSDIGLNNMFLPDLVKVFENNDIKQILPKRYNDSNKGSYGKVLCICGSYNMAGAAILSATAAYRTGAGLVKVFTDYRNREILQSSIPEALLSTYDQVNERELLNSLDWADSILIGCGIGINETSEHVVKVVFEYFNKLASSKEKKDKKLIVDADALNVIAKNKDLLRILPNGAVLTPHVLEMSRLSGKSVSEIKESRIQIAEDFSKENNCILVLKDSRTVIASYDGRINLNVNGNNGMSTGGSGDVLAGMISAMAAGGTDIYDSTVAGVFMHGLSADISIGQNTYETLISSDISSGISSAYKLVTNDKK